MILQVIIIIVLVIICFAIAFISLEKKLLIELSNSHTNNYLLRKLIYTIGEVLKEYKAATKKEKDHIIQEIIDTIDKVEDSHEKKEKNSNNIY